ncbi:hypothetical protein CH299_08290 [Rhodococcus sp. 14-2686-1-2]|nr:hypothetical protein CH301_07740 [Rhodococcus sp. 15-1189-1-1a]OZF17517.1 hypothetical protein CH299_08290 [Rhodococcus sp. 14-2686-1-2]
MSAEIGDTGVEWNELFDGGGDGSAVAPAHDSLSGASGVGSVELFDLDDDGYEETRVSHTEAGLTVARDRDGDGVMDTFTSIQSGGRYQSWEISRADDGTARWEQTASGETFE